MVLFLDPDNERAKQAVKKWEFLTADEYGDDVFRMRPVTELQHEDDEDDELQDLLTESGVKTANAPNARDSRLDLQQRHAKALERAVSLADAFTVRNDLEAALKVLEEARRLLGPMSEIENRHRLLTKRLTVLGETDPDDESDLKPDDHLVAAASPELEMPPAISLGPVRKREILETLLRRINDRRT